MRLVELFVAELEREAMGTRRVLERVPEGRDDWKPHPKSMPLGTLANLVASMPSWITMMIEMDELDIDPPGGKQYESPVWKTRKELVKAHDEHVAKAKDTLNKTSEDHLMKIWSLKAHGQVMDEKPRHIMI